VVHERGEGDVVGPSGEVLVVVDIVVLEVSADYDLFVHQCELDHRRTDLGYYGAAAEPGRPVAVGDINFVQWGVTGGRNGPEVEIWWEIATPRDIR